MSNRSKVIRAYLARCVSERRLYGRHSPQHSAMRGVLAAHRHWGR